MVSLVGSTGFLGRHVLEELLTKDFDIWLGIRLNTRKDKLAYINNIKTLNPTKVTIFTLDILEKESWQNCLKDSDCIIYCISIWSSKESDHLSEDLFIEVEGFLTMLNAIKELQIKRMILPGSLSNVLNGKYRPVYTESHWSDPSFCDKSEQAKLLIEKCAWNFQSQQSHLFKLTVFLSGALFGSFDEIDWDSYSLSLI